MPNRFIHDCTNLFRLIQQHLLNPSKEMSVEQLDRNFGGGDAYRRFIIPMTVILALASILASLLWRDALNLAAIVYSAILAAVSPVLIFNLVKTSSLLLLRIFGLREDVELRAQKMTLQLMLLYFAVEFLCAILPGANLLLCLYVYAFYMIWHMSGNLLGMDEHQRIKFMLAEMAVCTVTYILITIVFRTITPKRPN